MSRTEGAGAGSAHSPTLDVLLFLGRLRRPYIVFRFSFLYGFMFVYIYIYIYIYIFTVD